MMINHKLKISTNKKLKLNNGYTYKAETEIPMLIRMYNSNALCCSTTLLVQNEFERKKEKKSSNI